MEGYNFSSNSETEDVDEKGCMTMDKRILGLCVLEESSEKQIKEENIRQVTTSKTN